MGRYLERLKQLESAHPVYLKNLINPMEDGNLGLLGSTPPVYSEKKCPGIGNVERSKCMSIMPDAVEVNVQCSHCKHFQKDTIGSGQGVGNCMVGQAENQHRALWPNVPRLCSAWTAKIAINEGLKKH